MSRKLQQYQSEDTPLPENMKSTDRADSDYKRDETTGMKIKKDSTFAQDPPSVSSLSAYLLRLVLCLRGPLP